MSSTSQSKLKTGNVTIKSSIRLNAHIEDLCKKTSRKVHDSLLHI